MAVNPARHAGRNKVAVPLTTVKSGAGRPLAGIQVGRSDAMTACSVQIPKLIVRKWLRLP